MNAERHRRISNLFLQVCELPMPAREQVLRDSCTDDPSLFDEVRALLEAHDSEPVETDSATIWRRSLVGDDDPLAPPKRIGRYEILGEIGGGGMGTVYRGRSRFPDRQVALKIIRQGLLSAAAVDSFEHEVQVLGRLRHPGIAQVYEAGTFESVLGAQPFLAMELVEGPTLRDYVERHSLSTRQRLGIFARICDAVHHAHLNGVVHRDLKPSNILIEGDSQPKVLDFGIALVARHGESPEASQRGEPVGTFEYMSPEQAAGELNLDPRSDVYSLGVLLFELVSGRVPVDLDGKSRVEILETLRRGELRSPVECGVRDRDLQAILVRALSRSLAGRYQSASEFAADIRRYLRDEPLQARTHTARYLASKFAKRNKALVGSGVALFTMVLLAAILAFTLWVTEAEARVKEAKAKDEMLRLRLYDEVTRLRDDFSLMDGWPSRKAHLSDFAYLFGEAQRLIGEVPELRRILRSWSAGDPNSAGQGQGEWFRTNLVSLIDELDSVERVEGRPPSIRELVDDLEHRKYIAEHVERVTVFEALEAWEEAAAYVLESPVYPDFPLIPQVGLIPLGPDPSSGLLEFWCWETGEAPRESASTVSDPDTRFWEMKEETGLILVLLPGGRFEMGFEKVETERPELTVELAPYFLSKYEMTQAQWSRLDRLHGNPSEYHAGLPEKWHVVTPLHPVESVTHERAQLMVSRLGLDLPTEGQWEFAAGVPLGWSWPFVQILQESLVAPESLLPILCGLANIRDQAFEDFLQGMEGSPPDEDPLQDDAQASARDLLNAEEDVSSAPDGKDWMLRDGYPVHAPIARFPASAFGLHDMIGNVPEWCREHFIDYATSTVLPRTGERIGKSIIEGAYVARGGGFLDTPIDARVHSRKGYLGERTDIVGVRPSRDLDEHPLLRVLRVLRRAF